MPNLTAIIAAEIVSADPTSAPCDNCGETPWLNAFAIVVVINDEATNEVLAYLCPDCVEMIRENAEQCESSQARCLATTLRDRCR